METSTSPRLFVTADGSHSLRSERFDVAYHSIHGAIQESRHVFMNAGFAVCVANGLTEINVLEMGFGTGLNAFLVLREALANPELTIHYRTIEQFPITREQAQSLNYPTELGSPEQLDLLTALHAAEWDTEVAILPNFLLTKRRGDLLDPTLVLEANWAHTVFYDAFAPESQSELWGEEAFTKVRNAMADGGNLVTYCAKGVVKRQLKALGFALESIPGPPGKREMTRVTK